jgi:hypothetical protein
MVEDPLDLPDALRNLPPKDPFGKVVLINFGILLLYFFAFESGGDKIFVVLMIIPFHAFLNLCVGLFALFEKQKRLGKALLLSALLVPIVGYGLCSIV